ncbi:hypothetical protein PYK79_48820 [Streptomyces sp. ID05-04B]|nr:hypothetical protein [Streptomyces sp. ID05-04B]
MDAHHHLWDLDRRSRPRPDEPGHEPIRRSFGTGDPRSDATRRIAGRPLTRTVTVQCVTYEELLRGCSAAETEAVLAGTATGSYRLEQPPKPPDRKKGTPCS